MPQLIVFPVSYYPNPTQVPGFSSHLTHLLLEPMPDDSSPKCSDLHYPKSYVPAVAIIWALHYMPPCSLIALCGSHTHAETVSAHGQAQCPLCTIFMVPCRAWLVPSSQYSEGRVSRTSVGLVVVTGYEDRSIAFLSVSLGVRAGCPPSLLPAHSPSVGLWEGGCLLNWVCYLGD